MFIHSNHNNSTSLCQALSKALDTYYSSWQPPWEVNTVLFLIVQRRRLKHRKLKWLGQDHTVFMSEFNAKHLVPESLLLISILCSQSLACSRCLINAHRNWNLSAQVCEGHIFMHTEGQWHRDGLPSLPFSTAGPCLREAVLWMEEIGLWPKAIWNHHVAGESLNILFLNFKASLRYIYSI